MLVYLCCIINIFHLAVMYNNLWLFTPFSLTLAPCSVPLVVARFMPGSISFLFLFFWLKICEQNKAYCWCFYTYYFMLFLLLFIMIASINNNIFMFIYIYICIHRYVFISIHITFHSLFYAVIEELWNNYLSDLLNNIIL